jgi:Fibronectin type III domain
VAAAIVPLSSIAFLSTPASAGTVTGLTVSPSVSTVGANSTYTVGFVATTALATTDSITLTAAAGTAFSTAAGAYTVNTMAASPVGIVSNSVTITVPVAVLGGATVTVTAPVVNPTGANPAYSLSASTTQDTTPASGSYGITPGPPAHLTANAGGGQVAKIGTTFATPFGAALTDSFGNPISGTSVTFAPPPSGAGGTFSGGGSANTDAVGLATSHSFTANGSAGSYAVTASTGSLSASFLVTNFTIPGAPSTVTASADNNSATVRWVAPSSNGFSGITGFVITVVSTGAQVTVGNVDHGTVNGLTNNVPYSFTVAAVNAAGTGPASSPTSPVRPQPTGYWLVGTDGGIFAFGHNGFFGSTGSMHLNAPIVGLASSADGNGYWLVASDGGIFAFGDAVYYGSMGAKHLNSPIVGMAATPDGNGYWLVASDGGIFTFGSAGYHGSMGAKHLNQPIVAMTPTPSGAGYWLVASDGGIFTFGTAGFFGSTGGIHLNRPIVGMDSPDSGGYWLVASDGGIFAFGDAGYFGSTGAQHLNAPIVGIKATSSGSGYWLAASDGGIFAFGNASFDGSQGGSHLNRPIVGIG